MEEGGYAALERCAWRLVKCDDHYRTPRIRSDHAVRAGSFNPAGY